MVTRVPTRMITTTGVQAGSYTAADITVNEAGQITSASNGVGGGGGGGPKITNLQVTSNSYVVLDDTAVDTSGGFIKITGTNFVSGCMVYVASTPANSTIFVSTTEVRAQLPAIAAGTYPVYLVNPDGGTAIRVPGVTFSASPAWQTASSLGEQYDGVVLTLPVVATDATVYTLSSGSLPPGLSLNSNTGVITGTVSGLANDTVYSFTITATDAQLQDSPRTFTVTITVSDPYFKLTTLLLSGSALSANTVIRDSSTNNFNLTAYGDSRASNFTPYGTGWSVYFDGTGDYLSVAQTTQTDLGANNFTVEMWVYFTGLNNSTGVNVTGKWNSTNQWILQYRGPGQDSIANQHWRFYFNSSAGFDFTESSTTSVTTNTWYHIAMVRNGSNWNFYRDGIQIGSTGSSSATVTATSDTLTIGSAQNGNYIIQGYISNYRLVVGTALYTANFTPATTNLTSVANTSLLTCNANRFIDSSTNNFAITPNGDARVVSFNPFGITNTGVNGSMYFDGSGDYVSIPANVNLSLTTSVIDFTIEAWVYPLAYTGAVTTIISVWPQSSSDQYVFSLNSSGILEFHWSPYSTGAAFISSGTVPLRQYSHVAVTRSGNTFRTFINGSLMATATNSGTSGSDAQCNIGYYGTGIGGSATSYWNGYISNLRVVKGTALYTASFTPPTSPLTAIANTQLLTLQYDQPHNNHTFLDSSSNQFLITRSGNATQGTFSPFSQTGWGNYFGSSTSNLKFASAAGFAIGAGNFSIECFVNLTAWSGNQRVCIQGVAGTTNIQIAKDSASNDLFVDIQGTRAITYAWTPSVGQWYHIALVRSGTGTNQVTLYIDGSSVATGTSSASIAQNQFFIGGIDWASSYNIQGYISNFRYSNVARTITVPTSPYTSDANTLILTCQSNRFVDNSASPKTITINGTTSVVAFSPFAPTAVYNPAVHGGSAYFDGSGDYISIPNNTALDFGTGDFTLSMWIYPTTISGTNIGVFYGKGTNGICVFIQSNGTLGVSRYGDVQIISSTATVTIGQWAHIVISRVSGTTRLFLNGTAINSVADTRDYTSSAAVSIGVDLVNTNQIFYGYISSVHQVKGVGVTTVTVPTAPVTATNNTSLLLNFTDTAILDSTGRNVLETVADAKTSSVITKFTGGSMYFDGTGDALYRPNSDLFNYGTGNFTIDFWIYYNSISGYQTIASLGYSPQVNTGWLIQTGNGDGKVIFYVQGSGTIIASDGGAAISTNQWYHIAVVRNSGTTTIYRNGTAVGSGADTTNYTSTGVFYIGGGTSAGLNGGYFNGYLADFRITKGYARYTGNFTAPTVPHRLK